MIARGACKVKVNAHNTHADAHKTYRTYTANVPHTHIPAAAIAVRRSIADRDRDPIGSRSRLREARSVVRLIRSDRIARESRVPLHLHVQAAAQNRTRAYGFTVVGTGYARATPDRPDGRRPTATKTDLRRLPSVPRATWTARVHTQMDEKSHATHSCTSLRPHEATKPCQAPPPHPLHCTNEDQPLSCGPCSMHNFTAKRLVRLAGTARQ